MDPRATSTLTSVQPPIRVLIAAGDALGRAGLKALLATEPNLCVIEQTSSGPDVVRLYRDSQPDVVLLDLHLYGHDECRTVRLLCQECPEAQVIVLSTRDHPQDLACARAAGARGYLLKDELRGRLATAICEVYAGRPYFPNDSAKEGFGL